MPDAVLALDLDRALDGEDAGDEARELAALLVAAAEPARFDVSDAELERALRSARPRRRARRRLLPALALVGAAAAAAVIAWIAHTPGSEVQARAARALESTFFVVQQVRSPLFADTDVNGYVDGRTGRAHVRVSGPDGLVSETSVAADGRVQRWLEASNTTTIAPSCDALPGGCAEALDPLDLYLRTLGHAHVRTLANAYLLTIRSGKVEQVVTIDRRTYLPRRIEWRQDGRRISETRFVTLEQQRAPVEADGWSLSDHPGARVVQLTAKGEPVRVVAVTPGTLPKGARWLGARYDGRRARVENVRLTEGSAVRIAYGPLVVWNYDTVVPPAVAQLRGAAVKTFEIPGGVVHASFAADGGVLADATFADGNVAVVSRGGDKEQALRAVQRLVRGE